MRIAQLTQDWSLNGGVATYVRDLTEALAASGHEVLVVHAGDGDEHLPGVTVHSVSGFSEYRQDAIAVARADSVVARLSAFGPEVVHIQSNNNFLLEAAIRQRFSSVKTLHVYDFCPTGNKFHHALQRPCRHPTSSWCLLRMGYKRCVLDKRPHVWWRLDRRAREANTKNAVYPALVVASDYVRQEAIASGYLDRQLRVVPYFTKLPGDVPDPTLDRVVLFCGRLVPEKGGHRLLSAIARLTGQWRLRIVGSGPERLRLERLAHRLGVTGRVEFAGWADRREMARHYEQATVVVVPSLWPEPFGIVGIEAMAHARPVVAFAVGGIPEWMEDGVTGFLVRPYDLDALADRLRACLESPALARALGERGRARVESEFTATRHLDGLMAVYDDVRRASISGNRGRS